jgi:hypothetical protein
MLALLLLACGGSEAMSSGASTAAGQSGVWGFGECSLRCERMKPQLISDFGVTSPIDCWSTDMFSAGSLQACDGIFRRRWGVSQ